MVVSALDPFTKAATASAEAHALQLCMSHAHDGSWHYLSFLKIEHMCVSKAGTPLTEADTGGLDGSTHLQFDTVMTPSESASAHIAPPSVYALLAVKVLPVTRTVAIWYDARPPPEPVAPSTYIWTRQYDCRLTAQLSWVTLLRDSHFLSMPCFSPQATSCLTPD